MEFKQDRDFNIEDSGVVPPTQLELLGDCVNLIFTGEVVVDLTMGLSFDPDETTVRVRGFRREVMEDVDYGSVTFSQGAD